MVKTAVSRPGIGRHVCPNLVLKHHGPHTQGTGYWYEWPGAQLSAANWRSSICTVIHDRQNAGPHLQPFRSPAHQAVI